MFNQKLLTLLVLIILHYEGFSQTKLVDQNNNSPVSYVHILLDDKLYTYSNQNGEFEIATNQKFDTIMITHLLYETKRLSHDDFKSRTTIALKEKATILNEVVITSSAKKRKTQILLPEKSPRDLLMAKNDMQLLYEDVIIDTDVHTTAIIAKAVYVPNKENKEAVIRKIILKSVDKQIAGDTLYIPFKVNLMTYDSVNKIPDKPIFTEDLSVGKRRGETLIIDLSKETPVQFPKIGICIVVSVYRSQYYINKGYKKPPSFHAVQIPKSSLFREYSNGIYSSIWTEQTYSKTREQCFDFGIEIEFAK